MFLGFSPVAPEIQVPFFLCPWMDGTRKTQEQFSGMSMPVARAQTSSIQRLTQQIQQLLILVCGDILHSSTIIYRKSSRQTAFLFPISLVFSRLAIVNPPTPDKFIFLFKY